MEGLTYETKSQAETAIEDYRNQGLKAEAIRTREGNYRVLLVSSSEPEIEEKFSESFLEEEIEERGFAKEERREARMVAKQKPKETAKHKLEAKHKELERINEKRVRLGMEKGAITEVRDPETYEVIDYRLAIRDTSHKAAETISKKIPGAIGELPQTGMEFAGGVVASTSRQMNVKRGMKASIPGRGATPAAAIAWLPEKDEGYIGARRPAIGKMETVDLGKVGIPILKAQKEEVLGKNPLKVTPRAEQLRISEEQ